MKNTKRGAKTSIYLASTPDIDGSSGKYFKKRKETKSVKISYDATLSKQLWDVSVKLTNVDLKRNLSQLIENKT